MAFFFGQGKVVEEKRSWHHLPIYWGFLVLSIATLDIGLQRRARRVVQPRRAHRSDRVRWLKR
jgi:hypothetical protein